MADNHESEKAVHPAAAEPTADQAASQAGTAEAPAGIGTAPPAGGAEIPAARDAEIARRDEEIARLRTELDQAKDRALRSLAELDNYRKRADRTIEEERRYVERSEVPEGATIRSISGTQVREDYLAKGREIPAWFTRPAVAEILRSVYRPRTQQGFCVWLTGLPSAGKSTIGEILGVMLLERGRSSTILDGDVVRQELSKGLGFSREDRLANNRRIGFVAQEIVRHGGTVVCPVVSPYEAGREEVREMVGRDHFILVYVDTPLAECERRDVKGMYARARRGEILGFTGIDDPYEVPARADVVVPTPALSPSEAARRVLDEIARRGFIEL